jgi:hypothetical protein
MEIIIIIIMLMFICSLALIMLGLEESLNGLITAGLILISITVVLTLALIFGIATIISWLFVLSVIHLLMFAVCYKAQRLADETDKKDMIVFATIPICNIVVTIASIWTFMNNKYDIGQKIKEKFIYIINKIEAIAKKTLDGILKFIDKCPPNIDK